MQAVIKRANKILASSPVNPPTPPAPSADVEKIAKHIDIIVGELTQISSILKGSK